jgi:hypothetical protein
VGRDLDFGRLADLDKTDVAVRHHRFDLEVAPDRDNHKERLGRRYYAPQRMHRELRHDAVDRRGQQLQSRSLLGFDQILRQPSGLWFGLGGSSDLR